MQKNFRIWAIGIVAFLLCFSLAINVHCVMLLTKYRQIYQAPIVWVTEGGEYVTHAPDGTSSVITTENYDNEADIASDPIASDETDSPEENEEAQTSATVGTTVYITKSGTKFHRDGCSSLSKSRIAISYEDAVSRGFEPCGRCAP